MSCLVLVSYLVVLLVVFEILRIRRNADMMMGFL